MCAESVILDGCVLAEPSQVHQPALNKALGVFVTEQDIFPVSVASGADCRTDTCVSAVAAVLLQDFENGLCVVVYVSRTLSGQERKYSVYELEALAVLFGVEKFRMYLEHSEFLLQTDKQALSWVLARPRKSGRLARLALRVSAFRFRVEHVRVTQNMVADTLSRMFDEQGRGVPSVQDAPPVVLPVLCEVPLFVSMS
ncbi:hypothetical protein ANN_19108 [Periplaneta americana]|uniref:Reverse transcriptase RNase H-like domain-containing protein n=1 Tax=Periplaneta americana TaxID=6978 RepID=A0ABQ8S9L8_PERAM|nr:hypothetical protein ANN_19108 [Periplaneta americana]